MKSDLDSLMQTRDLDALLVFGAGQHNPAMVYLSGRAHLTDAYLVKRRGSPPVLFHRSMEREEADGTGLQTHSLDKYQLERLLKQMDGDYVGAYVTRLRRLLEDVGVVEGSLGVSGLSDAGSVYAILSGLQEGMPGLKVVGEIGDTLLLEAMATKEPDQIDRIKKMGQITTDVVGQVADFLVYHQVVDQVLVKSDGLPLTIGEVKRQINLWLVERCVENPKGTIFAMGRQAGIPHSIGDADTPLRLGCPIIFDIFPCEEGGGYFYDFTRTWCLGFAPDEVSSLYEDVLAVYTQVREALSLGASCRVYQELACELFHERGHPTVKETPGTLEGYVHSLGHGVGLHIHERPFFRLHSKEDERLDPNVTVTIEPGLYYPERGMGVRLEDTLWMRPDGRAEVLADYPLDLVLSMK